MAADTIDLNFLGRQQEKVLREMDQLREEMNGSRMEMRQIRTAFTSISEHFSRQERRIQELRDDLETVVKIEIGGTIANLETRFEVYVDQQIGAVNQRLDGVDQRLASLETKIDTLLARK